MLKAYSAIACGIIAGFGVVFTINQVTHRMQAATRMQCELQEWPAHQHAEHVEFCRVYVGISSPFNE